jgi:hypothetical protein
MAALFPLSLDDVRSGKIEGSTANLTLPGNG